MAKILKFHLSDEDPMGVKEVLTDAIEFDFDEVVLVGFKEGQAYACKSDSVDQINWLGALAYLQQFLYEGMTDAEDD